MASDNVTTDMIYQKPRFEMNSRVHAKLKHVQNFVSAPFAENFYAEEKTPRKKRRNPNGLRLVRLGFWTFRRDFHALKDSAFLFSAY